MVRRINIAADTSYDMLMANTSQHVYDANGERVYKLVGTTSLNQLNGGYMDANVLFDACVLYPNPYIVVTKTGYTKHYYAGTERLATVIGGGGLGDIGNPINQLSSQHDLDIVSSFHSRYSDSDPFHHANNLSEPVGTVGIDGSSHSELEYTCSPLVLTDLDVLTHQNILLEAIEQNAPTMTLEQNVYFFHGDHLGSANWITDANGNPIQYIHYAPYGELIANQQTIGYDERFKFTGKERDAETGYDYFGARFYWSADGIFTTVDPLADKNISNSPYMYCSGNPIMLVDPDGRDGYYNGDGDYVWYEDHTEENFTDNNDVTWKRVTGDRAKWDEAITIRDAVIYGLSQVLDKAETDLKASVELYDENSCLFTKETHFVGDITDITSKWERAKNTETGPAYESKEIGNSGYSIKFYSTKGGPTNRNAMGVVKSNFWEHSFEAVVEILERYFFGDKADNDPVYDMHVNNARNLIKYRDSK